MTDPTPEELRRRWRLVLGGGDADGTGQPLSAQDVGMDRVLEALYDSDRRGGLGSSSPRVNAWLGDIRRYFPRRTVELLQRDALDRLGLEKMLLQPELLEQVQPDVNLVATLLTLKGSLPAKARDTARAVVRQVADDVERRLAQRLREAVRGALDRSRRTRRPRHNEIDWDRTIRANLRRYDPQAGVLIPERLVGHARKGSSLRRVILAVDQSGSMASSVVYAGIFGAVLATVRSLSLRMCVFDTEVADLSEHLSDPVSLLFATQLGGGTGIHRALGWAEQQLERPQDSIVVLITDLFEGGDRDIMFERARRITASGATCICLLALSDDGKPVYDRDNAASMQALGWATFGCTPDAFPELLARAIEGRKLQA